MKNVYFIRHALIVFRMTKNVLVFFAYQRFDYPKYVSLKTEYSQRPCYLLYIFLIAIIKRELKRFIYRNYIYI